jgi:hypothetical protein
MTMECVITIFVGAELFLSLMDRLCR